MHDRYDDLDLKIAMEPCSDARERLERVRAKWEEEARQESEAAEQLDGLLKIIMMIALVSMISFFVMTT